MTYSYLTITPIISRPIIEIIVKSDTNFAIYPVLIDSGADYCIFSNELAKDLGIKLQKTKVNFRGIGKDRVVGRLAEVELRIANHIYKTKVLFADINQFGHGVLGQLGFFDHFDVHLSRSKQIIEISPVKLTN